MVGEASPAVSVGSSYQATLGWWLPMHSVFLTWADLLIFSSHVGKWKPVAIVACV